MLRYPIFKQQPNGRPRLHRLHVSERTMPRVEPRGDLCVTGDHLRARHAKRPGVSHLSRACWRNMPGHGGRVVRALPG